MEELHDQGFVDAGIFYAEAMDTKMHLMLNDAYDIRAVIYERANSGVVLDLVTLYGDGTGITYVNRRTRVLHNLLCIRMFTWDRCRCSSCWISACASVPKSDFAGVC